MSAIFHQPGFRLLCIDPGVRGCGVAEFVGGELKRAGYALGKPTGRDYSVYSYLADSVVHWWGMQTVAVDRVIIEYPVVYPKSDQQKNPNDVLDVAAAGSAVASRFRHSDVESVFPRDWKGQVPKDVMLDRIKRALHLEGWSERIQKTNKSDTEDILDACGIGLWRLGLINRKVIHNG